MVYLPQLTAVTSHLSVFETVMLGHASGVTDVDMEMDGDRVVKGGVLRTARRIMDGTVYIR